MFHATARCRSNYQLSIEREWRVFHASIRSTVVSLYQAAGNLSRNNYIMTFNKDQKPLDVGGFCLSAADGSTPLSWRGAWGNRLGPRDELASCAMLTLRLMEDVCWTQAWLQPKLLCVCVLSPQEGPHLLRDVGASEGLLQGGAWRRTEPRLLPEGARGGHLPGHQSQGWSYFSIFW